MGPFVKAMLQHFAGQAPMGASATHHEQSAPQRADPPSVMMGAMTWLPRPSFRTAVGVGLVAAGLMAARTRRPPSLSATERR
jgi:protease I